MALSKLVDRFGQPIEYDVLDERIAEPQLVGVRQAWHQAVTGDLTPERMAAILESSMDTIDPRQYLYMAEEMEEKETHYFAVLAQRKLAVESVDAKVEAASDSTQDVRIADAVRDLFELDCVVGSRFDLLDGLGKSFGVSEIVWDTSESQWQPKTIVRCEPSWFLFDLIDRSTLRLRDMADPALGAPLKPFKFIVHKPRLKSGLPIRNGLARIVAFVWIAKQYMLKDWLAFAEVFGMPIRIGRYGGSATPQDVAVLRRAVANIGSDAACVIPESMKLELVQVGNVSGAADLFERGCKYLDEQISKAVVGQTSSADHHSSGLGSRNADVHNQVRGDIRDADCLALANTYNRDLVRPFVDLNFGPQRRYPTVHIRKPKARDLSMIADSLAKLVPVGLRVEASEVRDMFGFSEPAQGKTVELLQPPPAVATGKVALNRRDPAAPATPAQAGSVVDGQVDLMSRQADKAIDGMYAVIRDKLDAVIDNGGSLQDFRDQIMDLYPRLNAAQFANVMQMGFAAATLAGRYEVLEESDGEAEG